jgi:bacillithiol biosynthesis cysteine-adding enzyme BshC
MFAASRLSYKETNSFSKIVLDYLRQENGLSHFYSFSPTIEGIKKAIAEKQNQKMDRQVLVQVLKEQYSRVETNENTAKILDTLLSNSTFTVCTAHQPNLLTGPLYFIYKILHAIKLTRYLKNEFPENNFVPIFYMGCEDADKDELNHYTVAGKKYLWKTDQTGAVGRMIIDKEILKLVDELQNQIGIGPFGNELISTIKKCFKEGDTIQNATFRFIHSLFASYGLLVLIPDHADLKKQMIPVFEDDLLNQKPSEVVESTCQKLGEHYPVQAQPREINLFYLKDNIRERIEKKGNKFHVINTEIHFSEDEIKIELQKYPERFSPNVILRGLFQESILPNIAFIGGGGELAYWLQLKDMFKTYAISFPVLILRNSFLILEQKWQQKIDKLNLDISCLFLPENDIMNLVVHKTSGKQISLNGEFENASALYDQIIKQALDVDPTLSEHATAIKTKSIKLLKALEKKMLRSEKRKFSDQRRQVQQIKSALFPNNVLQERIENFSGYYANWGKDFIDALYENSPAMDAEFTVLQVNN